MIAIRIFECDDHQHQEIVSQTGPDRFELVGHTAKPYGGPYARDLTLWELMQWATARPEQVTLIPRARCANGPPQATNADSAPGATLSDRDQRRAACF